MKFDRNTVIGFVVLALLFFGYFYFNNQQQLAYQKEKAKQDSLANARKPKPQPAAPNTAVTRTDSVIPQTPAVGFQQFASGAEQLLPVSNGVLNIVFSNKGGQPKKVELLNFKGPGSSLARLASTDFDKIDYAILASPNSTLNVASLYFTPAQVQRNADGSQVISYSISADGKTVTHQYTLKPNNYMIDFNVLVNGANQLLSNNTLSLTWQNKALALQKDIEYERQQSSVNYFADGEFDFTGVLGNNKETFEKGAKWVAVKQQFFATTLGSKEGFSSVTTEWINPPATDSQTITSATSVLKHKVGTGAQAAVPMFLYYGPTDYKILKQYGNEMEDMVNLGSGIFSFVKYINRGIILPVFDFLKSFSANYGIAILLLTLFIRLLTSPLMYPGYLTSAKMKVLRPELEQLKKKHGDDQQAYAMEQMKFLREAGVNQFAGCLPSLVQIPIFVSLFNFFNSNISLRGQSFLWAKDLSQYDSILDFGFRIPLFGDHLSLFALTAAFTSFLISLYGMSATPTQDNPVLKYMPYFFPIVMLFFFNHQAAGLTWYYTVSNIITLILQFVIQNYIINHDKIVLKIEENRKKPKTKSKWQEQLEKMQEQQRQMQEVQKKGKR